MKKKALYEKIMFFFKSFLTNLFLYDRDLRHERDMATAGWNVVHRHLYALKINMYITAFKLITFYFSLYCLFLCHFWSLFKINYLKIFTLFLIKTKFSLCHLDFVIKKNILIYYVKVGLHGRIFIKIDTIFKNMSYYQYSFGYTER